MFAILVRSALHNSTATHEKKPRRSFSGLFCFGTERVSHQRAFGDGIALKSCRGVASAVDLQACAGHELGRR